MNQEIIDINIPIQISVETLIDSIKKSLSKDEIIDFIKALDLAIAEYDFTEKIRDHFVLEMEKEDNHYAKTSKG